jgi:hypothetical protein
MLTSYARFGHELFVARTMTPLKRLFHKLDAPREHSDVGNGVSSVVAAAHIPRVTKGWIREQPHHFNSSTHGRICHHGTPQSAVLDSTVVAADIRKQGQACTKREIRCTVNALIDKCTGTTAPPPLRCARVCASQAIMIQTREGSLVDLQTDKALERHLLPKQHPQRYEKTVCETDCGGRVRRLEALEVGSVAQLVSQWMTSTVV